MCDGAGAVRGSPDPAPRPTERSHDLRRPAVGGSGEVGRPSPSAEPFADLLSIDRRRFLEASGFALFLSALGGCMRAPVRTVLSPASGEEGATAGLARYYASTCGGCPAACGLLVKTRDGRPIKLEGNPDHALSQGGLCAVGQAEVLGLYDSQRLRAPQLDGQPVDWGRVDQRVRQQLAASKEAGRSVVILTGTVHSPTTRAVIQRFLTDHPHARHVAYDPLSASAIGAAHQQTHGLRVVPRYRFDRADVIVAFGRRTSWAHGFRRSSTRPAIASAASPQVSPRRCRITCRSSRGCR